MRLAVLISGGGRTLINLLDCIERGELPAAVVLVVASKACLGADRARDRGLPVRVFARREFDRVVAMHDSITAAMVDARVELVCLAGYLRWMRVDPPFRGRVINIHPALLPDFGGPGMHGMHVHRAVLDAGRSESGCTVHFVDEQYDHGPVILQRRCPVLPGDTEQTLADRVFAEECIAYPQAIRMIAGGDVKLENGRVVFAEPKGQPVVGS
jgi:formyltetrahydrofolate-dependent phosphoribosylglycinamide formyltransferase